MRKEPLVSLKQAIEPLHSIVPDVEEMLWTVSENCKHPPHHLSSDELAAIMLYTLEWMPREASFYYILNQSVAFAKSTRVITFGFAFFEFLSFATSETSINYETHYLSWYQNGRW